MTTVIRDFWLSKPEYWIAVGQMQALADKTIYDMFYKYDISNEDNFGKVVYYDQFMRHFSRMEWTISENDIIQSRENAAAIVKSMGSELMSVSDAELVWYLMPFKHLHEWHYLFETITSWLAGRLLVDFHVLNRFFMDSYKKAYTSDTVIPSLADNLVDVYDTEICESHPLAYSDSGWSISEIPELAADLISPFNFKKGAIAVSLSGGIDSMLMTALLKRSGFDVVAIHIIYGNRRESSDEFKFIKTFCNKLGVPLYYYAIKELRRDCVDRAFYEKMTRDIRFCVYRAIGLPVLLGHIQEDVIENIWTNIAHGTHLDNLAKLELKCFESGVLVVRPWLNIKKGLIYKVADLLAIPHLKNTTPSWSNRGKFREHFYRATHAQYGEFVDEKLLEVASRIKIQAALLDKLLFQDISASWCPSGRRLNVTKAVDIGLDAGGWLQILTDLTHNKLGLSKPSYSACEELERRVKRGLKNGDIIHLKKHFAMRLLLIDGTTFLECL
jgi:tRNA(Ile)-lysidine synthase TilS/MesJ